MHEYLGSFTNSATEQPELFLGDVVQAAVHDGPQVEATHVSDDSFLDIGTPEDLLRAVRRLTSKVT